MDASNNLSAVAVLDMQNSTISKARVGITVKGRADLNITNSTVVSGSTYHFGNTTNFVNNRIGILYLSSAVLVNNDLSLLNFETNSVTYPKYGPWIGARDAGHDAFVKIDANHQIKFEGCHFTNSHFTELGLCAGVISMASGVDFMFGDIAPSTGSSNCRPNAPRFCRFVGLETGIHYSDPSYSPTNRLRVLEGDFYNTKNAIVEGLGLNSFIYKNEIEWDANFSAAFGYGRKLGVFSSWVHNSNILENNIINNHTQDYLALYADENAPLPVFGGANITGNTVDNSLQTNRIGTAQQIDGNNTNLQITCNTYLNVAQNWLISANASLADQGDANFGNNQTWTNCNFGIPTGGLENQGLNFDYFSNSVNLPPANCSQNVQFKTANQFKACSALLPCSIYSTSQNGEENGDFDIIASMAPKIPHLVLQNLMNKNYSMVTTLLSRGSFEGEYSGFDKLITQIMPAFTEDRKFYMNHQEKAVLREAAKTSNFTGLVAREFLYFYCHEQTSDYGSDENKTMPEYFRTVDSKTLEHSHQVVLHPNPAQSIINLETKNNQKINRVDIYNSTGQLVKSISIEAAILQVDVSQFANGVYWVKLSTSDTEQVERLIIQK